MSAESTESAGGGGVGWIAAAREREREATPGPWHASDAATEFVSIWGTPAGYIGGASSSDAEFIAAARTDLGRALDALDAVLALHQPQLMSEDTGFCLGDGYDWPCPTVRAIQGDET